MTSPHDTHSHFVTNDSDAIAPHHPSPSATLTSGGEGSIAAPIHGTATHGTAHGTPAPNRLSEHLSASDSTADLAPHGSALYADMIPGTTATAKVNVRLSLSPIQTNLALEQRPAEALRLAIETFPQTDTWVVFYREILGTEGVVRKLFKTVDEVRFWEASKEYDEVHTMLAALRSHDNGKGDTVEAQRMITVRLPVSLHEALKVESDEIGLSINKLCITKLLLKVDGRFVPQEPGKRRGRKPGPQGKREKKTVG